MKPDNRFKPNRLPRYSEADIIEEIRRVVGVFGGSVPNSTQFESVARVSLTQIYRQFGTYKDALAKAGFSYIGRGACEGSRRKFTPEQVLNNLREVLAHADGYEFSLEFYRKNGGLLKSRESIKNILGLKWRDALAKVGAKKKEKVQYITPHSQRLNFLANLTNDQLLAEIWRVWESIGRCPSREDVRKNSTFLNNKGISGVVERRFGSWSKAIKVLCEMKDLPVPRISGASLRTIFDQEPSAQLIKELQSVGAKFHGESLTHKNYGSSRKRVGNFRQFS